MGTNYYAYENTCECCGRGDHERHIGKSSAGWCFSLHVHPDEGINTLEDWKLFLASPGITIRDEYGTNVTQEELFKCITERSWNRDNAKTPYGYASWDAFHRINHSKPGPNGLLRHVVDGRHCIGNGEGTWDYIVGEFS